MNRRFTRVIGSYEAQFELTSQVISFTFRSYEDHAILSAHFIDDSLPHCLTNVINSIEQLFTAIINIRRQNISIIQNDLVLRTEVFSMEKQYALRLSRADLSQQQRFMHLSQELIRNLQMEASDIFSKQKKAKAYEFSMPRSQIFGQSQSNIQSKKQKLLTQLNSAIQQENHELIEKNQNMAKQLEIFEREKHQLKANNFKLSQQLDLIAENNKKLIKEKQRLAQLIIKQQEREQKQRKKLQERQKEKDNEIKSKVKSADLRVSLIKEQKEEFSEIASIFEEKAEAVRYKLDLAEKVKALWSEVANLEQQYKELNVKKETLSIALGKLNK